MSVALLVLALATLSPTPGDDDLEPRRRRIIDDGPTSAVSRTDVPAKIQPPPTRDPNRGPASTLVALFPENPTSAGIAAQLTPAFEDAVSKAPHHQLVTISAASALSVPQQLKPFLAKARASLSSGKAMLRAGKLTAAERQLRNSLDEFEQVAGYADPHGEYGDALAHLGAIQVLRGNQTAAYETFRTLAMVDRQADIGGTGKDKTLVNLFRRAKESIESAPRGKMLIYSTPAGARVTIDGTFRGYTPLSVNNLPIGYHHVKLQRLGTYPYGEFVRSRTGETTMKASLQPTPEMLALDDEIAAASGDLDTEDVGPASEPLTRRFKAERLLIARVNASNEDCAIDAAIIDAKQKRRLVRKSASFASGNPERLLKEAGAFAREMMDELRSAPKAPNVSNAPKPNVKPEKPESDRVEPAPKAEKPKSVADPLDSVHGTEDW